MRPAVSKLAVTVYGMPHFAAARRGADLFRRRHGFDPGDVGAAFAQALDLLDEDLDRLVFAQRPERGEEVAGRSDRAGDDDRPPRAVGDRARVLGGEPIELARAGLEPVQHQAAAIAAETVGQNDVGAGVDESPMQALDAVRDARRSKARDCRPRSGPCRTDWCRSRRRRAAAGLRPEEIATFFGSLGRRRCAFP